jgi:riboflavin kinase
MNMERILQKKLTHFFLLLQISANLSEPVVSALPKDLSTGIYYGWASLHGTVYKMVASIGWNPYYKNEKKSMV